MLWGLFTIVLALSLLAPTSCAAATKKGVGASPTQEEEGEQGGGSKPLAWFKGFKRFLPDSVVDAVEDAAEAVEQFTDKVDHHFCFPC
jgi:hypothetical protein